MVRLFSISKMAPHERDARAYICQNRYNQRFAGMSDIRRGLIIVNTGPGKGKTTAAMGTALRAVGQGMRVLMLQFLKGSWHYGELDAVQAFGDKFVMKQMGRGFVKVGSREARSRRRPHGRRSLGGRREGDSLGHLGPGHFG